MQGSLHQARAAGTQRVAKGDGAAIGVDAGIVVGQAQLAGHGQALRGEGFVEFDDVEVMDADFQAVEQLAYRRHRADTHYSRRHPGAGHTQHLGTGSQAVFLHSFGRGQNQRHSAVVNPRGVAGSNGIALAIDRFELG